MTNFKLPFLNMFFKMDIYHFMTNETLVHMNLYEITFEYFYLMYFNNEVLREKFFS